MASQTITTLLATLKKKENRNPNANHGRLGADDYSGCVEQHHYHESLSNGDPCPSCSTANQSGKVYDTKKPILLIKLQGQSLINGVKHVVQRLRCSLCGEQFQPKIATSLKKQPKYSPSCLSALAIGHYFMGQPFKRLELNQSLHKIPLADATQWDKVNELAKITAPIHQCLEKTAAQGDTVFFDDTPHKILDVMQEIKDSNSDRKGIYTTAVISKVCGKEITLFYTSKQHAGENISDLMALRDDPGVLTTMSDASSNNNPKDVSDKLLAKWLICFCLVHGRRKFFDILSMFEAESTFVIKQIGYVYLNERHCKQNKLSPDERLAYHQKHSAPHMEALKIWLNNQAMHKETEANSGLGNAIKYMLRHWDKLTRFLHYPGAPIDNSLAERAIKVAIRYRKNSLFYKTTRGAAVGDNLMSVIYTAMRSNINVFGYLNALQEHKEQVALEPERWLPWHYQDTLLDFTERIAA